MVCNAVLECRNLYIHIQINTVESYQSRPPGSVAPGVLLAETRPGFLFDVRVGDTWRVLSSCLCFYQYRPN